MRVYSRPPSISPGIAVLWACCALACSTQALHATKGELQSSATSIRSGKARVAVLEGGSVVVSSTTRVAVRMRDSDDPALLRPRKLALGALLEGCTDEPASCPLARVEGDRLAVGKRTKRETKTLVGAGTTLAGAGMFTFCAFECDRKTLAVVGGVAGVVALVFVGCIFTGSCRD